MFYDEYRSKRDEYSGEVVRQQFPVVVKELLRKGSLTIKMKDYARMGQFGSFGVQLPTDDVHIITEAGDVILSEGSLLVIYYAQNTRNFTQLGKVQDLSDSELKKMLGKGNITVTLMLSNE